MKPIKRSVAFVIYSEDRTRFLIVRRPPDDDSLPNVWGLPAGSLKESETSEESTRLRLKKVSPKYHNTFKG